MKKKKNNKSKASWKLSKASEVIITLVGAVIAALINGPFISIDTINVYV